MKRIYIILTALLCATVSSINVLADSFEAAEYLLDVTDALSNRDTETAYTLVLEDIAQHPKDGYAQFLLGVIYYQKRERELAIKHFEKSVKLTPSKEKNNLSLINYSQAICYLELADTVTALSHIDKAIKLDPKDIDLYNLRGSIYTQLCMYDKAENDYLKALSLDKDSYKTLGNLGDMEFNNGNYAKSLEYYNYMTKINPYDYNVIYSMALAYYNLELYSKALSYCLYLIDNNEFYVYASLLLSNISEKDFDLTVAQLTLASKKDPSNIYWKSMLSDMYRYEGNYEKAIEYLKEGMTYEPSAELASDISDCYYSMCEYTLANEYIDYAISLDSTNNIYIKDKALILHALGMSEQSMELLKSNLENDSTDYDSRLQLAEIYFFTGQYENCIEETTIILEKYDYYTQFYERRGRSYLLLGKEEEARKDFETIIEKTEEPDITYAFSLLFLGESEKAIEIMTQLISDSPDYSDYYNMACMYSLVNDKNNALKYLRLSLENGYKDYYHLKIDPDFNNIRESDEYKQLIEEFTTNNQ